MRIFFITSKLRFEDNGSPVGGSVVDLHLKAKGLAELGHDVSVVTAFSNADKILCGLPYRVYERFIKPRGLIGLQRGVYTLLKEFESKADVFYIDGHIFLYGGGAYRLLGGTVPVVGFFNVRLNAWADTSGNAASASAYRRVKRRARFFLEKTFGAPIANRLDAFIFNTPHVQRLYHEFGIGVSRPNAVIQDFVATSELSARFAITEAWVKKHQLSASPVTVLATGRMIQEKGFDLIIRAFAGVPDKKNYRVIISGGGPDKERLEKLVRDLTLTDYITFPGWVEKEKLYGFFKEAHVFVFPKWWVEYGSAVLTEAMAFGLPSIIPGKGALEWLTSGAALTFTSDRVEELAKHFSELQKNYELRMQLGTQSFARAQELDYLKLSTQLEQVMVSVIPQ